MFLHDWSIFGLTIIFFIFAPAPCQNTSIDYSGTQVVVALTSKEVLVGVDSEITHVQYGVEDYRSEGYRKLVDIGDRSACGIEGFLGPANDNDIAAKARAWTKKHPHIEADEAMNDLLLGAKDAFSESPYLEQQQMEKTYLTNARADHLAPLDYHLTRIYCGTFKNGKPLIVLGETYLETGSIVRLRRKLLSGLAG